MRIGLIFLVFLIENSLASPNGAPPTQEICESMAPIHGVGAQSTTSPFNLEVSTLSLQDGEILKVEIFADEGKSFKGFYLQARTNEDKYQVIGEFLQDEDEMTPFNYRDCFGKFRNAVTHASRDLKTKIGFKWKAPENFQGSFHFRATIVEEKTSFWLNHLSENIEITLREPEVSIYEKCGVSKFCFGLPRGCLETQDCISFGAVIVKNGVYDFEMLSSNTAAYIALALSDDEFMGGDSAIECVNENGNIKAYTSFTRAIPNDYGARRNEDQSIITLKESRLENGAIYCKVEREPKTRILDKDFDLTTQEFHLLIASGTSFSESSIFYHNINRAASEQPISFVEDNPITILPPPETTVKPVDDIGVYEECSKSKSCIGLPDGCVKSQNCLIFGAVIVKDGSYQFEIVSPSGAAYAAIAVSNDDKMGKDSVIECVNENNEVKHYSSVTRAIPNNYGARRNDNQNTTKLIQGKIENGVIYCRVEMNPLTIIDDMTFDLVNNPYFLLIATGPTQSELSIGYHGGVNRGASRKAFLFSEVADEIELASPTISRTLLLIHASFMIVSWIGATSIGVFSARYFKTIWKGTKMLGKDAWFIVHQVSMTLTWILTISAVIIIWIDVGEWRTSTHSVLGIIATSLCFIQPITAFFRPAPTDPARPIFNFMHGSVGKLAHFLAVITIFFSTSMQRAELPDWMKFVLIAYVVVYFVFYALLNNLSIISDIKERELNEKEVEQQARSSPPLTTARRILFILFSIVILGFVITLINAVAL